MVDNCRDFILDFRSKTVVLNGGDSVRFIYVFDKLTCDGNTNVNLEM